jgi:predicted GIY-YIG superfamily endonuclease
MKTMKTKQPRPHHNVYVIELDPVVLQEQKRFVDENPDHDPAKACLYVGMTGRTPEERFEQHREGIKSSKYPHRHSRKLRSELYERHNPMTFEDACAKEVELAKELRSQGHAVWQR